VKGGEKKIIFLALALGLEVEPGVEKVLWGPIGLAFLSLRRKPVLSKKKLG
jgi:hypothetical protein